jgi:protein phosphatase
MGTTEVVAALDGDRLILGNIGDSLAYILQDGQCIQLTVDHSYANELIRNGALTIETAHKHGAAVLLTSDGLTRYLDPDEIASILAATPFDSACATLIDIAKQRGGVDNITCLLLLALDA